MKIEHVALNVPQPVEMAKWWAENLGMKIVMEQDKSPFMHFLADDSGQVMVELYNNPVAPLPDYFNQEPRVVHVAFVADDPDAIEQRLTEAGATSFSNERLQNGTHLLMMRDPWGVAIQFCKRQTPMI